MLGIDPWFLDFYVFIVLFGLGVGLLFALIGLIAVAVEGPKAWNEQVTFVVVMFPLMTILFPLVILAPFYGIYRLIRRK